MFQIETTEWYCSSFKLCNKLFCLDSSQVGRTLSYNWIHTVYSKHLRFTPDGAMTPGCHCLEFDSWWFLRKQRWGFGVAVDSKKLQETKMWRVFDSCGTCGKIWILWVKVQRWETHQPKRESWSPAQEWRKTKALRLHQALAPTALLCFSLTETIRSCWNDDNEVSMMCQWYQTTVTPVKFFKVL